MKQQSSFLEDVSIGIGVLSWKAHQTLTASLQSYQDNGFLDLFDEKMIYFSDMGDEDISVAKRFKWRYSGGENKGIAEGMKRLAEALECDYILLLQNDNPIIEEGAFAIEHIKSAVSLLRSGACDLVRMRHRWQVGEGFVDAWKYLRYYPANTVASEFIPSFHGVNERHYEDGFGKKLRRLCRPIKAKRLRGRSIFTEANPEQIYPDLIARKDDFLIIDSSILHFTDQCLLISRDLWLNTFVPFIDAARPSTRSSNGFKAPELAINGKWWRNKHFKIGQGRGLFTHARYDGSFRPNHKSRQ